MRFLLSVSLICAFFPIFGQAQNPIRRGTYTLSGDITYSREHTEINGFNNYSSGITTTYSFSTDYSRFTFYPGFSLFVSDHILLGGSFHLSYQEFTFYQSGQYPYEGNSISRSVGIGPEVRYYLSGANPIFFQGSWMGTMYSSSSRVDENEFSNVLSLGIGADIFVSGSVAVEPLILYSNSNYHYGSERETIGSWQFGVGINYFIPRGE